MYYVEAIAGTPFVHVMNPDGSVRHYALNRAHGEAIVARLNGA